MSVLLSEPSKNTKVDSNDNLPTAAYAAAAAKAALGPITIGRRAPRAHEVLIDILYCGICHSDIHQAREEWGGSIFPMVPGHEIAGVVSRAGSEVTKFKVGDKVGVGCFVDSCRHCANCKSGHEQYCLEGMTPLTTAWSVTASLPRKAVTLPRSSSMKTMFSAFPAVFLWTRQLLYFVPASRSIRRSCTGRLAAARTWPLSAWADWDIWA